MASSIESPADLRRMRQSSGASFEFLSDPEGKLIDLLDVRHAGGRMDGEDIAQSASFLVNPRGEVLWGHLAENYRVRPEPEEILRVIDSLPAPDSVPAD